MPWPYGLGFNHWAYIMKMLVNIINKNDQKAIKETYPSQEKMVYFQEENLFVLCGTDTL